MNTVMDFKSPHYEVVSWSDILTRSIGSKSKPVPTVISYDSWAMIPLQLIACKNLRVVSQTQTKEINQSAIQFIEYPFLEDCNIKIAKVEIAKSAPINNEINDEYLICCALLCHEALLSIEKILHYTYEHLAQRESENMMLTQHEAIQIKFANIICQLESAKTLLVENHDINKLNAACHYMLAAIHCLAELGGGRSMLRGNAVELLFHVRFFQTNFLHKE